MFFRLFWKKKKTNNNNDNNKADLLCSRFFLCVCVGPTQKMAGDYNKA